MIHSPRWCLTTTPHSGTRYIRDAFINAGYVAGHQRRTKYHIDGKTDLLWGHCDVGHGGWMETVAVAWPLVQHLLVLRDPIHNLCTHFGEVENEPHAMRHIKNSLDLYRRIQETYIEQMTPYFHCVEDPLDHLSCWAGIELKPHGERHSRPNALRQAIDDHDLDRALSIMPYGGLLDWFINEHSANIAPLYRDKLGYDFWWQNG